MVVNLRTKSETIAGQTNNTRKKEKMNKMLGWEKYDDASAQTKENLQEEALLAHLGKTKQNETCVPIPKNKLRSKCRTHFATDRLALIQSRKRSWSSMVRHVISTASLACTRLRLRARNFSFSFSSPVGIATDSGRTEAPGGACENQGTSHHRENAIRAGSHSLSELQHREQKRKDTHQPHVRPSPGPA